MHSIFEFIEKADCSPHTPANVYVLTRDDALEFHFQWHSFSARPGGFATHIDPSRTVDRHGSAGGHRVRDVAIAAAIAERVGRDVEHAHDDGHRPSIRDIASERVAESRNCPRTALVVVVAPGL